MYISLDFNSKKPLLTSGIGHSDEPVTTSHHSSHEEFMTGTRCLALTTVFACLMMDLMQSPGKNVFSTTNTVAQRRQSLHSFVTLLCNEVDMATDSPNQV